MKQLSLAVKTRPTSQQGTAQSKRLRRDGFAPAEVYGHGESNLSITLPTKEFSKMLSAFNGENVLFSLQVEGGPAAPVLALVKEIQYGRMDHTIQHVDFLKVKMDEKIRVRIPVHILNADVCAGVKEGGTLQHFVRSIEVQCLPTQVPEHLDLDAAPLVIGSSIHVSGLKAPEGVRFITDPMTVVVMVAQPVAEEKVAEPVVAEGAVAGEAAPAAGAEPEVLTAKKKEEGAAPAADGKKPAEKGAADKGAKK